MKLRLTTPNTLILGAWNEAGLTAIKGAYRNVDGELTANIYQNYGDNPWQALCESLNDCMAMRLPNLVIVCNDRQMVKMLTRPIKLPALSTKRAGVPKNFWGKSTDKVITYRNGSSYMATASQQSAETIDQVDTHLWSFARMLMRFERWLMMHSDSIPGTQTYWQECQREPADYCNIDDLFD